MINKIATVSIKRYVHTGAVCILQACSGCILDQSIFQPHAALFGQTSDDTRLLITLPSRLCSERSSSLKRTLEFIEPLILS